MAEKIRSVCKNVTAFTSNRMCLPSNTTEGIIDVSTHRDQIYSISLAEIYKPLMDDNILICSHMQL